jgi:non-ribosomal peptide synthase protein (TIGR01720 family)
VRLTPAPGGDPAATIDAIKHQLRQVPDNGIGYGLLRYLDPGTALDATEPGVTFNYLGQFDQAFAGQQLFHVASESSGQRRSPHTPRDDWFVINAVVYDHVLRVDWEYSPARHDRDTVARLLADYLCALRALIRHCNDVLGAAP